MQFIIELKKNSLNFRNALYVEMQGHRESLMTYIEPFQHYTWAVGLALFATSAIILGVTMWGSNHEKGKLLSNVATAFMIAMSSIVMQGTPEDPRRTSSKVVFFSMFLTAVLMYSTYSACLTSFLAVTSRKLPFTDERSLVEQTDYKILTLSGSTFEELFQVYKISIYRVFQDPCNFLKGSN